MLTLSEPDVAAETQPRHDESRPAPRPGVAEVPDPAGQRRWRLNTFACFAGSVLVIVISAWLGGLGAPAAIVSGVALLGTVLFGLSVVVALYRAVHGVVILVRPPPVARDQSTGNAVAAIIGNLFMAGFGMLLAYVSTVGFSRGRQLRRFGRVLLPGLRSNPEWTTSPVLLGGHEDAPVGLADQWRENGKTEHASVAAFARLVLDLMALGAPPALIAAANRDALDEIRHAELCFSIARAIDGRIDSPAPFPEAQRVATLPRARTMALAKLAVDSLIDGALHEGVSARVIAKLGHRCAVPSIAAALKEIAADEGRHTAHGWAVVEWCLDEGGVPVAEALLGALTTLPREMHSTLPAGASAGGWEPWGIHGHGLEAEEYGAALEHLDRRVRVRIAGRSRDAA